MTNQVIEIAQEFSRYPGGRYYSDGPYSGQEFREKVLIPAIEKEGRFELVFDGARGYGSSFLEEAFGGLIRLGYRPEIIRDKFIFISKSDSSILDEISEYVNDALRG